jgi:hypothetical protein
MKNFKKLAGVFFILSLFLVGQNAFADMIIGSSGAGWQSWTLSDLNNNGNPYWDHSSSDVGNKNIGYCLTSNNCGLYDTPPGVIDYWGKITGAADSNFYFQGSAGSNDDFTLLLELAGLKNSNIFGWYEIDPVTKAKGNNHIIFNGTDGAGAEQTFTLSQFYGFFFIGDGKTYYTQSQYNSSDVGNQHFSIFKDDNTFWMGIEDLPFCNSDKDYNDMVLHDVTPSSVPEPSTFSLIVAGIFGIGILRRFKI